MGALLKNFRPCFRLFFVNIRQIFTEQQNHRQNLSAAISKNFGYKF